MTAAPAIKADFPFIEPSLGCIENKGWAEGWLDATRVTMRRFPTAT
jgi:hypothetical protein